MSSLPLELEARILWKTARLFKFLKWPSADEVDFGKFLVVFDFKQGVVCVRRANDTEQQIASFTAQKRSASVASIVGSIRVGDDYLVELQPATENSNAAICCSRLEAGDWNHALQMNASTVEWNVDDRVKLTSVVEGRDAFLKVCCSEEDFNLAVIVTALTVFLRFSH